MFNRSTKEKKEKLKKFEKDFANDPKKLKANVDYYLSGYETEQDRRDELNFTNYKLRTYYSNILSSSFILVRLFFCNISLARLR